MIIQARDGYRGTLVDLNTGRPIRKVIWFDTETGDYEAFRLDPTGLHADGVARDVHGVPIRYRGQTRLRWVPGRPVAAPTAKASPPGPGGPADVRRVARPTLLPFVSFDLPCQEPGCSRWAQWVVADEVLLSPQVLRGVAFERAKTVGMRYYCSWHYQGPRLYDHRGELIEQREEIGARPS